jgi:hypothetical protein
MRQLTLCALAALICTTAAQADVFIRGPFGGRIVVPSPSDVYVGPGAVTVNPAPALPVQPDPPPVKAVVPAPQPATAVLPQDFARTFQPRAGMYDVTFVHPRTNQPVTVAFELPAGNPQVSFVGNSLLFEYGRHEVEIRFQIGGRVKVIQR